MLNEFQNSYYLNKPNKQKFSINTKFRSLSLQNRQSKQI